MYQHRIDVRLHNRMLTHSYSADHKVQRELSIYSVANLLEAPWVGVRADVCANRYRGSREIGGREAGVISEHGNPMLVYKRIKLT